MIKVEKWVLAVLLPIIILVCVGLYHLKDRDLPSVESVDGVCDLTGVDFAGGDVVWTAGSVEYVEGELLTPEEFDRSGRIQVGSVKEVGPVLTSRLRILVPDDGDKLYAISYYTANYSSRIYINGRWLADYGTPGLTAEESASKESYITFTAQPENGVIEIVQQSSNFVFWENGAHQYWRVGYHLPVRTYVAGYVHTDYIILGCYLALAMIHLILFLVLPAYRANLYFALLCLVWLARTGMTGPKVLEELFPVLSWTVSWRVEYLSVPAAVALLTLAYHTLFPGLYPRWARRAICAGAAGFAVYCLCLDTLTVSYSAGHLKAFALLAVLYTLGRLCWKVRRPAPEQVASLLGIGFVMVGTALDIAYYAGLPVGMRTAIMGATMLVFSMFQLTAMLFGTMRRAGEAWKREQALKLENEALDRGNAMKRELLANLSHEMRTPLAVMSVYAQLTVEAIREGTVDEQTTGDLDTIAKESKRLAEMASEVMDIFSDKKRTESRTPFSLEALLRQLSRLCRPMAERGGNTLALSLPEDLPPAWGDPDRCTQLVWNLLSNSCAHTQGGTITIAAAQEGDFLAVTVTDTGEGIDPALLPHVLDRGVSATEGGHGLGLALCRQIVEEHGGTIGLTSEPGKGTAVRFTLRISREEA